jgi:hypothetical protein
MGATLVGFGAVRLLITIFVRKHYLPAKYAVSHVSFKFDNVPREAWLLGQNTLDRAGKIVAPGGGLDFKYLQRHCPNIPVPGGRGGFAVPAFGKDPVISCVQKLGLRSAVTFQPASRFWTFQWIEFALYAVLSLALLGFVIWRVSRSPR